jgi:peptide/nickel transport system ATP-binding protein
VVMYSGRVMETATVFDLFAQPSHPYTVGLLKCVPRLTARRSRVFESIPGLPPEVTQFRAGCPFAPRCERATDQCRTETPAFREIAPAHSVACWNPFTSASGTTS